MWKIEIWKFIKIRKILKNRHDYLLFSVKEAFIGGNPPSEFVRAAYSTATPDQMDLALGRFAELLHARAASAE